MDCDLADDLVQKIFIRLWQQRKNYRLGSSFEAYLYSIARNTLYDEILRSHRINAKSLKKQLKFEADTHNILSQPEAELYFQELTEAFEAAKAKLTDQQYRTLEASQTRDVPLVKVLKELGCSKEAYKKRLKRARKQIKDDLKPFLTDEES